MQRQKQVERKNKNLKKKGRKTEEWREKVK